MPSLLNSMDDTSTTAPQNPHRALLLTASGDVTRIQDAYATHREARTQRFVDVFLSPSFPGVTIDPILLRLEDPSVEPEFVDTRHCLTTWGRPPEKLKDLVRTIQDKLKMIVTRLWLMPTSSLHMTALEITHSRTPNDIAALVSQLRPVLPQVVNYTLIAGHRARLVKPLLSCDTSAVALTFLPAAGEGLTDGRDTSGRARALEDDDYTYHHIRADLFDLVQDAGVQIDSRYVVPSAHLTIARFVHADDFHVEDDRGRTVLNPAKIKQFVEKVREVNEQLIDTCWPRQDGSVPPIGEWVIGEEVGLESRSGPVWYGSGGELLLLGKGF